MCLCRLHNFCIDANEVDAPKSTDQDAIFSFEFLEALRMQLTSRVSENDTLVRLEQGRPNVLLHGGSHFEDAPINRRPNADRCPMDDIIDSVKRQNLVRPTPVT